MQQSIRAVSSRTEITVRISQKKLRLEKIKLTSPTRREAKGRRNRVFLGSRATRKTRGRKKRHRVLDVIGATDWFSPFSSLFPGPCAGTRSELLDLAYSPCNRIHFSARARAHSRYGIIVRPRVPKISDPRCNSPLRFPPVSATRPVPLPCTGGDRNRDSDGWRREAVAFRANRRGKTVAETHQETA